MQIFISPAKSLDFESELPTKISTQADFMEEAVKINKSLKRLSVKKIKDLQKISLDLSSLNFERNQNWLNSTEERQAVFAFNGDVYQGLMANLWTEEDVAFANDQLRILSGLYGILRPTDLIKPYRLEMGTKIKIGRKSNLYEFWEAKVKAYLKTLAKEEVLLNLASDEYFKLIIKAAPQQKIYKCSFKDRNAKGEYRVMSFYAKKARGLMASYIVKNRITDVKDILNFKEENYYFHANQSSENHFVFLRDKPA